MFITALVFLPDPFHLHELAVTNADNSCHSVCDYLDLAELTALFRLRRGGALLSIQLGMEY